MTRVPTWPAIVLAVAGACGPGSAGTSALVPSDELVLTSSAGGDVTLLDAGGTRVRSLAGAVAAPDGRTVYSVEAGVHTTVRAIDVRTGAERSQVVVEGSFQPIAAYGPAPSGLSPNGRWLVLGAPGPAEARFAIIDTSEASLRAVVAFPRNFAFDAINDDGTSLYLTEHVVISRTSGMPEPAGLDSSTYRLRVYGVPEQQLLPTPIVDLKLAAETANNNAQSRTDGVMNGIYQSSVHDRDGAWQYGFYYNPLRGPFIHALMLNERMAYCIIDLQAVANGSDTRQFWTLALSANGRSLYATNGGLGTVTEFDASTLETLRTATFEGIRTPLGPERSLSNASVAAGDGRRLYFLAEQGVALVDTKDMALRGHFLKDRALRSIALSADGRRLYSLSTDGGTVWRIDAKTGAALGEIQTSSATNLVRVLAP